MSGKIWQPGYLVCPAEPCTGGHRENAYGSCTPSPICGAAVGIIGIGCLQCDQCTGDPESEI